MAGRIGEGDSLLCGMAVGRLLRRVVHASSDGVGGNEGEGKEEEEEMLRDEDVPLLRDVWVSHLVQKILEVTHFIYGQLNNHIPPSDTCTATHTPFAYGQLICKAVS